MGPQEFAESFQKVIGNDNYWMGLVAAKPQLSNFEDPNVIETKMNALEDSAWGRAIASSMAAATGKSAKDATTTKQQDRGPESIKKMAGDMQAQQGGVNHVFRAVVFLAAIAVILWSYTKWGDKWAA